MTAIYGIPSRLRTAKARKVVRHVLRRIRSRFPQDFARLRVRVLEIRPLAEKEATDGTMGEWKPKAVTSEEFFARRYDDLEPPGWLYLFEQQDEDHLLGVAAHELGHACTRQEDRDRRRMPLDEWASELAADWYAYRWGFGRNIARMRRMRDWLHHGPDPGQVLVEFGCDGAAPLRFRITRNFCACPVAAGEKKPRRRPKD